MVDLARTCQLTLQECFGLYTYLPKQGLANGKLLLRSLGGKNEETTEQTCRAQAQSSRQCIFSAHGQAPHCTHSARRSVKHAGNLLSQFMIHHMDSVVRNRALAREVEEAEARRAASHVASPIIGGPQVVEADLVFFVLGRSWP